MAPRQAHDHPARDPLCAASRCVVPTVGVGRIHTGLSVTAATALAGRGALCADGASAGSFPAGRMSGSPAREAYRERNIVKRSIKRNIVKRSINRLKRYRRIATRSEKLACHYDAMLHLATILFSLGRELRQPTLADHSASEVLIGVQAPIAPDQARSRRKRQRVWQSGTAQPLTVPIRRAILSTGPVVAEGEP